MRVVVVDTNIIAGSPRLSSRAWTSLAEHAGDWDVRIIVPEVVAMEAVAVVQKLWRADRDRLAGLLLHQIGLAGEQAAMAAAIEQESADYEAWLHSRLQELGIEVRRVPDIDHMDIARRASAGRTPFTRDTKGKTKDGYRDTLIWMTLMAVAADHPGDEIWLVSDNHTDFGPKPGDWTGPATGERDDCPIQFHNELVEELAAQGLTERVSYVVNLESLEQHLASKYAPIAEADLEQFVAKIDMNSLGSNLMFLTLGRNVDPVAAALPAGAVGGTVVGVREQQEGWNFIDAARRDREGWTARFAVDTEVTIELDGPSLVSNEYTKVLRVNGQIAVSVDGAILGMGVTSAEALPDDPERSRRFRINDWSGLVPQGRWGLDPKLLQDLGSQIRGTNVLGGFLRDNPDFAKGVLGQFTVPDMPTGVLDPKLLHGFSSQFKGGDVLGGFLRDNPDFSIGVLGSLTGPNIAGPLWNRNDRPSGPGGESREDRSGPDPLPVDDATTEEESDGDP